MISSKQKQLYYKALIEKNSEYEGIFYVGVKTTGVFCRPTCPARKPKFENCEFYLTVKEALFASFRPCQRCKPLSHPGIASSLVEKLLTLIEANPEKRWKSEDLRQMSIDESTARRQFQKRFGMTFIEYARARRLGIAFKEIRGGAKVIDAQVLTEYESSSGFRDAFEKMMGTVSGNADDIHVLQASWFDTRLGPMIAMADKHALYLLEFVDRRGLELEVKRMRKRLNAVIIPGDNLILQQIKQELSDYFEGKQLTFKTPIKMIGSDFQKTVWHALQKIPLGETHSYQGLAQSINHPTACRAVARANGMNQLAIIIPCHRVINSNGELGGYAGGISRKAWLLNLESAGVDENF